MTRSIFGWGYGSMERFKTFAHTHALSQYQSQGKKR